MCLHYLKNISHNLNNKIGPYLTILVFILFSQTFGTIPHFFSFYFVVTDVSFRSYDCIELPNFTKLQLNKLWKFILDVRGRTLRIMTYQTRRLYRLCVEHLMGQYIVPTSFWSYHHPVIWSLEVEMILSTANSIKSGSV